MQQVADAALAHRLFVYHDGNLYWRVRPRRWPTDRAKTKHGWLAGCLQSHGYVYVRFRRRKVNVSHIVWLMHTGRWPELDLDHKDGVTHNNRFGNLQELTESGNLQKQNRTVLPLSGVVGVQINERGRFRASAYKDGKAVTLGTFTTLRRASAARNAYVRKHYVDRHPHA